MTGKNVDYHLLINVKDTESDTAYEDIELQGTLEEQSSHSIQYLDSDANIFSRSSSAPHVAFSKCKHVRGYIYGFLSCLFFATGSAFVKLLDGQLNPMEVVMFRSSIQLIFCTAFVLCKRISIWKELSSTSKVLVLIRGVFGGGTLILYFYAFQNMSIGDASSIIFSSPVYVSLLAWLCLGEPFGCVEAVVLLLTLSGVLLVSRPSFLFSPAGPALSFQNSTNSTISLESWTTNSVSYEHSGFADAVTQPEAKELAKDSKFGALTAFLGSLLVSVSFLCLRRIPHVHCVLPVFYASGFGVILPMIVILGTHSYAMPTDMQSWLYAVVVGICGLTGQIFLTKAFQTENAGPVSIVRQMDIVLAYLYQVLLFHDTPYFLSAIGAALIMSGTLILAIKKYLEKRTAPQ